MIDFILLATLSSIFGLIAGLIPGVHINLVLPFLLTLEFSSYYIAIFIISFSISQLFSSFFVSTFFGVPEDETALSVLPCHRLVLKGYGYEAFLLAIYSIFFSSILTFLIVFLISPFFLTIYSKIRNFVLYLIIFVSAYTILTENGIKILYASLIFLLSGLLGILTLYSPLINQNNSLLPLLTGFFGLSSILTSLKERVKIPEQKIIKKIRIKTKDFLIALLIGSISGMFAGFLPGIGVSQAVMLFLPLVSETKKFIVATASVSASNEIFSLLSLYLVKNPRSGASVGLQKVFPEFGFHHFLFSISILLISLAISFMLSKKFSLIALKIVQKIDYFYLNLSVILFIVLLVYLFSGFFGLIVLLSSTSLGLVTIKLGVKRVNLMGCLLIPSILFFSNTLSSILFLLKL